LVVGWLVRVDGPTIHLGRFLKEVNAMANSIKGGSSKPSSLASRASRNVQGAQAARSSGYASGLERVDCSNADADGNNGYCPYFQHVVELLGRRWTSSIVMHLTKGPARFSDIAGAIPGLSDRLLTERLHELESEKLVERAWQGTCTYYQFSDLGKELVPSIEALKEFAHKAAPTIVFAERPGRRL
jgi:DNA-binding HxlR family transcriptional regulator